ncbi:complexin-2 [Butyrivibrio fibrisolvens]|nr:MULTISPECIES: hypothetical protein [Lachnospiraceae]MBQ9305072.1 complexin-2 [Butyrivibrio sp.]MDC7279445.1 complexin-2 [Butyrivibrio fibrisolvens]SDB34334.1 hypothetical protein SAMN02910298_01672 [Pseudobutyrivibrio sp. YE44]
MKNIQIPQELFIRLIRFHLFDMDEDADLIKKGLEDKMERLARHEIYSKSKTASSEEEKEKARQEYLDMVGMHQDFRW